MFIDLPPDQPPVIMLAQASQDRSVSAERAYGRCLIAENNPYSIVRTEGITVFFRAAAVNYIWIFEDGKVFDEKNAKVTIVQMPRHGRLIGTDTYMPDQGYYGLDKVAALVELTGGERVRVVYFIHMVYHGIQESEESIREFCGPNGESWKISSLSPEDYATPDSWRHATSPQTLLTGAKNAPKMVGMLNTGEEFMFTMDVPYVPAQETPIVLASSVAPQNPDYIFTGCQAVNSFSGYKESALNELDPVLAILFYIARRDNRTLRDIEDLDNFSVKNITLLEAPKHGHIHAVEGPIPGRFRYVPVFKYEGKDSFVFMVEIEGNVYKIVMELNAGIPIDANDGCPEPTLIEVNKKPVSDLHDIDGYDIPDSWCRATSPQTLLTGAKNAPQMVNMLNTGEEFMFTMDVPYVPAQEAPIVLASSVAPQNPDYILTGCQAVDSFSGYKESALNELYPVLEILAYIAQRDNRTLRDIEDIDNFSVKNITLLEAPKHGHIHAVEGPIPGLFRYVPVSKYEGKDSFVLMAEIEGNVYKIVMELNVGLPIDVNDGCPEPSEPPLIKVNKKPVSDLHDIDGYNAPDSWYRATSLSVLLSGAKDALTGFADLSGTSLGQTTGDRITLDTNAAGHGWYIDYTPYLNEEWLPTSSPYEWQAKPGSDAEGKMDFISVVLHEYGHVLGLDHSTDSHDFMAATLQPGVRRPPSIETLTRLCPTLADAGWPACASTHSDPGPSPRA